MITYPTIFFGAGGPLKEDFEEYSIGSLPVYPQIWQASYHQWLSPKNPNKYAGYTWKDYGVSGAFDPFDSYNVGTIDITDLSNLEGNGNFNTSDWTGVSAAFYRDAKGIFSSADQLRGYGSVYFDWGNNAPIAAYKSDNWSAKFFGELILPYDGTYNIFVERDEAARVWVGREFGPSTLIFDKWGVSTVAGAEPCTQFTYTAGKIDLLIHFYDNSGPAKLKLFWQGPGIPYGPILPSDFGDTGYSRIFIPFTPEEPSLGYQNHSLYGNYQLASIEANYNREDFSNVNVWFTGNYAISVIKTDVKNDYSYNSVKTAGYHVYKSLITDIFDDATNQIQDRGFYAYKTAFVRPFDAASIGLQSRGFYLPAYVPEQNSDVGKASVKIAGFYIYGIADLGEHFELTNTIVSPQGYHIYKNVDNEIIEKTKNRIEHLGNYFPIYVYDVINEPVNNSVIPSGYYITGYLNSYISENTRVSINASGHHAYYQVTGDKFSEDYGITNLGFSFASYMYKDALYNDSDVVFGAIEQYGQYFPRYLNNPYGDTISSDISPYGYYYPRFLNNAYSEAIANKLSHYGYHVSGYLVNQNVEASATNVKPEGYYLTGTMFMDGGRDASNEVMNPIGNYFYSTYSTKLADIGMTVLYYNGDYTPIYIYTHNAENSINRINHQGLYYFDKAPNYQLESGYQTIDTQGFYLTRFESSYLQENITNQLSASGYYVTGFIHTYNSDLLTNSIDSQGNYFYRFITGSALESVTNNIADRGFYSYKAAHISTNDAALSSFDAQGLYFPRFVSGQFSDPSFDKIDFAGDYYSIYVYTNPSDLISGSVNMQGLYYPIYPAFKYQDTSCSTADLKGDYFYGRVPVRNPEPSLNKLSFIDSFYLVRFSYPNVEKIPASNLLILAGAYSKESWVSIDSTVLTIDFSSEYLAFEEVEEYASMQASISGVFAPEIELITIDYWLEIYKRPTYNMSKTQKYFDI